MPLQVLVFSLCLMLLLIMVLVRTALLDEWQRELPPRTPNHFLVNIAPYQVEGLKTFLSEHGLVHAGLYPMVPGRVLTINGAPARVLDGEELNIDREFNLTWSDTLPEDNRLVAGAMVGQRWARRGLGGEGRGACTRPETGDRIGIQIGADRFEATLSSIRELDWDSMRPNFFLMFPRQVLEQRAGMWLTSFYLEPGRKELLNELVREFPTVSVLEMDALLAQLRGITRQLSLAVEFVLLLLFVVRCAGDDSERAGGARRTLSGKRDPARTGCGKAPGAGQPGHRIRAAGAVCGRARHDGCRAGGLVRPDADHEHGFPPASVAMAERTGVRRYWWRRLLGLLSCRRVVNTPPISVLRDLG